MVLLADEALEDTIYDSQAMQGFTRIDLGADDAPDATTPLKFRRLLETNDLWKRLFTAINADLSTRGLTMREGTPGDATLIASRPPPRTRKRSVTPKCTKHARAGSGMSA